MTEKATTLRGHLDVFIDDTLARCTRCGKCFEACPMTRYSDALTGADPKNVVSGVLDWLKQTPGNAESVAWLKVCTQSSRCIEACPEGINAMKMVRVGQMIAIVGDPLGDSEIQVVSPANGVVIGRLNLPLVYEGDALLHIARVEDPDAVAKAVEAMRARMASARSRRGEPPIV